MVCWWLAHKLIRLEGQFYSVGGWAVIGSEDARAP